MASLQAASRRASTSQVDCNCDVDFALAFVVLLGMMLFYGTVPTASMVWLPLLLLLALVTSLGVGLWLTALVLSLSK